MLIVLSLLFPYLLGLGMLLFLPCRHLLDEGLSSRQDRALLLAAGLSMGLLVNYLILLVFQLVQTALMAAAVLSLLGFSGFVMQLRRDSLSLFKVGPAALLFVAYLAFMYCIPILFDPISGWDARSIWFLHGKMMFFGGGLLQQAGFGDPSFEFSHQDYPKLLPLLAAQVAYIAGFWNEYLPKASLLCLLIPALIAIASFLDKFRLSFLFLVGFLLFYLSWTLWDGYMDGYLALYGALCILLWGRWLCSNRLIDLMSGLAFCGVAANLKNEGMLFAVVACTVLLAATLFRKKVEELMPLASKCAIAGYAAIPVISLALWGWKKEAWGLTNDLKLHEGFFERVAAHLNGDGVTSIMKALISDALVGRAAILVLVALIVMRICKIAVPISAWFSLCTAGIYFLGIFTVYLATPADLEWHLTTSASRTMLPVVVTLFAVTFTILRRIEDSKHVKDRGTATGSGS